MWRPESWVNEWDFQSDFPGMASTYEVFELGADRMLEAALKRVGEWLSRNPHLLSMEELEALRRGEMPKERKRRA